VKSKVQPRAKFASLIAGILLFGAGTRPTFAHHSFAAEFDINKPITVTGVVSKVAWQNPHVYVYVDAKDESGKTVTYALECNSVNTLVHKGWTRDALKKGDQVTVSAYAAKDPRPLSDGSFHANARSIKFADGHTVSAGTSADDGTTKQ
jgi:Family of unknown function (DUF6152)